MYNKTDYKRGKGKKESEKERSSDSQEQNKSKFWLTVYANAKLKYPLKLQN